MQTSPVDGVALMLDMVDPHNLTTYNKTVTVKPLGVDLCLLIMPNRASIKAMNQTSHFIQAFLPVHCALIISQYQALVMWQSLA